MDKDNRIDDQLDQIFNTIDDFCLEGKFEEVDIILDQVDVDNCLLGLLIGYLTITLPFIKDWHIENTGHTSKARERFFFKVLNRLKKDKESKERIVNLLTGLGLEYYKAEALVV